MRSYLKIRIVKSYPRTGGSLRLAVLGAAEGDSTFGPTAAPTYDSIRTTWP